MARKRLSDSDSYKMDTHLVIYQQVWNFMCLACLMKDVEPRGGTMDMPEGWAKAENGQTRCLGNKIAHDVRSVWR